ncbi:MAG TPA: acyl-CoA dehydrogenase family protein [Jatrophihabitantaceae bacterium]|nr:acyl-CoA dehydrogenase family protein [Jatrophihabitantaceae bacterium]
MTSDVVSAEDTELLRSSVRDAFSELSRPGDVRRLMATATGWDHDVWSRLAGELGLPGLMLSAAHGGAGFSRAELAVVMEEAGATLLCAPLFATAALAVPLLLTCADEDALARYGPDISAGRLTATVALAEDDGRWSVDELRTTARRSGGGWVLDGVKNYVVDGATAGLVLVVAASDAGPAVFAVDAAAPGSRREQLVTLDQTRKQARLTFERTPAVAVGPAAAAGAIDRASDVSRALLAAEQTGGASRCLDLTVEYAKTRIQFARPIGSFQAVKQRLAEMLIQVESARSAAYAAAADDGHDLGRVARIAAITCTDAYNWVSAQTIQLHGGIGFTWEHDAHLYFKRARASGQLLGTPGDHIVALAKQLDAETAP